MSLRFLLPRIVLFFLFAGPARAEEARPNIVLIMADDLGYRDLGCYGAKLIETPRIDRLAGEGVRFTDAHSTCAVCNPSRYSVLSGTYLWHAKRKPDYSLYYHEGQVTLPSMLKAAGYHTAALGKWHNGFGRDLPEPDWNAELKPGPLEIGFDYFFGTPKTHNEPPLVFVENHWVVGLDPADPLHVDHDPKFGPHGKMVGGAKAAAARPDDQIDFIMAAKAENFFAQQTAAAPFFLYLAFAAPHVPIDPAPEFRGKSGAGLYGDYIQQLDHCTGLVLDSLEKHGFAKNTLVIFTSDNGGMYERSALAAGHRCNGELLGQKTDVWEGGHRVPLLARWPGQIPAGTERKALFTQVDLMATFAEAVHTAIPAGASPDGTSDLAAFLRPEEAPPSRHEAVFLGTAGFALRQENWLYIPKQGSGGMTAPETPGKPWSQSYAAMKFTNSDIDTDGQVRSGAPETQLYDLTQDLEEHRNIVGEHGDIAARMQARMDELKLVKKSKPAPIAPTPAASSAAAAPSVPTATPPASPLVPTRANVPYGSHPKQVLDFWQAKSNGPAPLLFFIHGGGWVGGNRMSGLPPLLKPMLDHGVSVVSIEYRFIGDAMADGVTPPVKAPMHDAARALQFVRSKAAEWNLDPTRVVASGGSAGSCTSLWLAFHDDLAQPDSPDPVARESTRLRGAAVINPQTSLDPAQMKEWTPNSYYGGHAFGIVKPVKNQPVVLEPGKFAMDFETFLARRDQLKGEIAEYSPYALANRNAPPIYMYFRTPPALGEPQKDPTHSANFGVKLKERLDSLGVPCELVYPGVTGAKHKTVESAIIDLMRE
jgi:arylsulfatase A-like enzyme